MPDPKTTSETTATSSPRTDPPILPELWGLWNDNPSHPQGGYWLISVDDASHDTMILVALSEREAIAAATYQNETYYGDYRPVRIK